VENFPKKKLLIKLTAGGVILIGGNSNSGEKINSIYHLSDANAEWTEMTQKLKTGRSFANAFLVPDEITNCK